MHSTRCIALTADAAAAASHQGDLASYAEQLLNFHWLTSRSRTGQVRVQQRKASKSGRSPDTPLFLHFDLPDFRPRRFVSGLLQFWIGWSLMVSTTKLIDEFRRGWQGISQPSLAFSLSLFALCLLLSTLARWGLAQLRPDVFFTPYLPAIIIATAVSGLRIGVLTTIASGLLGIVINFGDIAADVERVILLVVFWAACGLTIWGLEHYRSVAAQQRENAQRLIQEEEYSKLLINELQHRLKSEGSTIHAVLHQVVERQPQIWSAIDHRLRALSATDDLIGGVDGSGCDIRDLLLSELSPYGRFSLNGEALSLPAKLALALALIFHELATNAVKYGAFSSARGLLRVSWTLSGDRLNVFWDETEGPPVEQLGAPGFGTRLLKSALTSFDGMPRSLI
jgi:two-component sensor histidine kinase